MHKPNRAQAARVQLVRRVLLLSALAGFLSVTVLPLMLMLTGLSGPCNHQESPAWYEAVNPFSHHNLCHMQHSMANVHSDDSTHRAATSQDTATRPTQGSTFQAPVTTEQQTAQPRLHRSPSSPPPVAKDSGQRAAPAQSGEGARTPSGQQHSGADDEIDEIEMPQTDEDYERILRLPHYEQCNLCKVCVPYHVVQHHPKAKDHPSNKNRHLVDTHDPDVVVEKIRPRDAPRQEHVNHMVTRGLKTARPLEMASGVTERINDNLASDDSGVQAPHGGSTSGGLNESVLVGEGRHQRRLQVPEERDEEQNESDGLYRVQGKVIDLSEIAPGDTKAGPRKALPNCTACWGCRHTLEMMAMGTVMAGSYYAHEPGGSPSWLFRVRTNRTRSGWAVVKTWCVPVRKAKQRGLAMCSPRKVFAQVKLLLAQNKIIRQCGFDSIVPSLWVEPLVGVIPGHGFRIDWLALWAEIATGTSLQNIQEFGKPQTNPGYMLDLFTNKVNHTDIKMIAIFDVLFSQCDRHQQNIFITEEGKVWAIDNDQVFSVAWRKCGFDSMVLPTTQKFMINHLGFFYVLKYPHKDPPRTWTKLVNPLLLLDYRCHVEGGAIGFSYPDKLKQCLADISSMDTAQIREEYGYPHLGMADAVRNRTTDLLNRGFEWTLLYGQPTNQPMHRYKVAPSCCAMDYIPKGRRYECKTPWVQMSDIPYGNPWHGGKWHGTPGKDTGSYVGGTEFM